MRNKVLFCVLFIATAVVLPAAADVLVVDSSDRTRDAKAYNVLEERIFEGTVANKGQVIEGLVYFPLITPDGVMEVQIGPEEFVAHSKFKIKLGDKLTVIGMRVVPNERNVVLAREISGLNGILMVRDRMGLPLWETDRPIQMDPELYRGLSAICKSL